MITHETKASVTLKNSNKIIIPFNKGSWNISTRVTVERTKGLDIDLGSCKQGSIISNMSSATI